MAWENCVDNLKATFKHVKEVSEVNWKDSSLNDALEGDTFKDGNPFYLVCTGRHCVNYVSTTPQEHAYCHCKDIDGRILSNCTPKGSLEPVKASMCLNTSDMSKSNAQGGKNCMKQGDDWYLISCYCCCACFAYNTKIGVGNGVKVIQDFHVGDRVLTANISSKSGKIKLDWNTTRVNFSSGTGPDSHQPCMVYIRYGNVGTIIVTPDHLFLMATGKVKRADRLVPDTDFLVTAEGRSVAINEISLGEYHGGVHHIATEKEFNGDLDGHLLISEGIVTGDFNLQIHADQLKAKGLIEEDRHLPKIGTSEYEKANTHLTSDYYQVTWTPQAAKKALASSTENSAVNLPNPKHLKFYAYGEHVSSSLPPNSAQYLTEQQEIDVRNNGDKYSFSETSIGITKVEYVLRLFQGFYPDIIFYHEPGRVEVNGYAFTQYGKDIVLISGGLTRLKNLGIEGLALIFSHLVARLRKTVPLDSHGNTSVAMADYYSSSVLRPLFFGREYSSVFDEGVNQITENIFDCIKEKHDKYDGDPYSPTRETRLDALHAGDETTFPPENIGGPVWDGLHVISAHAQAPVMNPTSFITEDVDAALANQVYSDLQDNGVLDNSGQIIEGFDEETNLAFLFPDEFDSRRNYLTEMIRGILFHACSTVQIRFNLPVNAKTGADPDNYEIEPSAPVKAAVVSPGGRLVTLSAELEAGINYTVAVHRVVSATNGSTLDENANSASFTLGIGSPHPEEELFSVF